MPDAEFESFKANVSIMDVAINEFGFEHDVRDSCKSSTVLRAGGDKIVVSKHKTQGHDVYFGREAADRGSVIDFVRYRVPCNNDRLIPVRQLLRSYAPGAKKPAVRKVTEQAIKSLAPVVVEKDLEAIQAYVSGLKPYSGDYLTVDRGLSEFIINQYFPVGVGQYGNAIFVHENADGEVCGYEVKNRPPAGEKRSFTGFSEGGEKGLFIGRVGDWDQITEIVITESAIDAMSYAEMNFKYGSLYISTGGTAINDAQRENLICLFDEYPDATLVMAMDNDAIDKQGNCVPFESRPGDKMANQVRALALPSHGVIRHMPKLKDWNADLLASLAA